MLTLIGKTAVGKDSVLQYLTRYGMSTIVSYTTRPPRVGEEDGVTYHFVSKEKFLKLKKDGFFAETTSYNVATGETWYYGSAIEDLKDDSVIILNPEGLKQIKKVEGLNPVSFLITASEDTIRRRLEVRGDKPEEAERRLKADREDFKDILNYVDFAFSNDLGVNVGELAFLICNTYETVNRALKGGN